MVGNRIFYIRPLVDSCGRMMSLAHQRWNMDRFMPKAETGAKFSDWYQRDFFTNIKSTILERGSNIKELQRPSNSLV